MSYVLSQFINRKIRLALLVNQIKDRLFTNLFKDLQNQFKRLE
jgi:hypothetical protein